MDYFLNLNYIGLNNFQTNIYDGFDLYEVMYFDFK